MKWLKLLSTVSKFRQSVSAPVEATTPSTSKEDDVKVSEKMFSETMDALIAKAPCCRRAKDLYDCFCKVDVKCAAATAPFDHKFRLRRNCFTVELERQTIGSELRHTSEHVESLIAWYVLCVRYEHADQLTRCAFRYMLDTVMSVGAKDQYHLLSKLYQTYQLEIEVLLHHQFLIDDDAAGVANTNVAAAAAAAAAHTCTGSGSESDGSVAAVLATAADLSPPRKIKKSSGSSSGSYSGRVLKRRNAEPTLAESLSAIKPKFSVGA